jgi:PIN domain nuclease of toxin-antitoxin system
MRFLLDAHLLVWLAALSERLPAEVREIAEDPTNEIFFSSASIWELTIQFSAAKTTLALPPNILYRELIDNDFEELPVSATHALAVETLPWIHKDPFDRILIAQSISEGMLLLTSDDTIAQYSGPIRLVR